VVHGRIGVDKTSPWVNAPAGTQARFFFSLQLVLFAWHTH
jgi:hypothetical protein